MTSDETQPQAETGEPSQAPDGTNGGSTPEGQERQQPQNSAEAGSPEGAGQQAQASAEAGPAQAETPPRRQRQARDARGARGARGAAAVAVEEAPSTEAAPPPRLLEMYRNDIVPTIMREFGFTSPMRVPRIQKIVLNIGVGEALTNSRAMDGATSDLTIISGQKPVITRARKSIANFKIREGNPIGTSVTLRGARMYHFLDRLINTALPRIRDFRGIQRGGFDGRGNFSIGIREQIIFPEIDYNQIDRIRGLQVTVTTSARNDGEAIRLLELYGMPFVRQS